MLRDDLGATTVSFLITFQQGNIERRKTSSPLNSLEREENKLFLTKLTEGFLPLTQFLGLGKIFS